MNQDRIIPGILLMLAFCVLAPLLDVSAKLAAEGGIPVGQVTFARFAVQTVLMLPFVIAMGHSLRMDGRALFWVGLRAVFLILSTFSFVSGIRVMPLADALAIVFIEPFILLFLGWWIFGDRIGPRRVAASAVGFVGVLLVIQPSFAVFGPVAFWPLGTAVFFSFYMLVTRAISAYMHPVPMQLHTSWLGLLLCLPLVVFFAGGSVPELDTVRPVGWQWLWLFGVGFWAAVSHMCMTYALKYAPASVLAPLHYLELVVAVTVGFLIFGDLPNRLTLAGIAVIVGAGLYVIHRERIAARRAPAP